jgi:tetratricopeptide (TPR) repeat protein
LNKVKTFYRLLIVCALLLSGCVENKYGMDQSGMSRGYHNTTSRYNGYFYAHQKMQTDMALMQKTTKDDYTKLLPLYIEPGENNTSMNADMDSVIKKASLVVQLHTDRKSGKAKSQWIPDCYLLLGQAHYYKKEYDYALSNFEYLSSEKKYGAEKKQGRTGYQSKYITTKEEGKLPYKLPNQKHPFYDFVNHKPARSEGIMWLIQTYITTMKYDEAITIINTVLKRPDFPNGLRGQLEVYHADLYIRQEQYQQAIQPLKNAIILTKNKKLRTRYIFILAQLYQKLNDNPNAYKQYGYVLKGSPSIEMEFYSKLFSAYAYEGNTNESYYKIIAMLQQMAENKRYDDYYDQIYYAIGAIYEKEGNTKMAVENYQQSAHKSVKDPMQKGRAYVAIGNIYFKQDQYIPSKFAYDSALMSLKAGYDSLNAIKERHSILVDLVKNLAIIQREDSVQKIAKMSDKDREAYLDNLQKKIEKQKEEEQEAAAAQDNLLANSKSQQNNSTNGGGWYFYNTDAKGSGYNQFLKIWGKRTNEDDWRRSNKNTVDVSDIASNESSDSTDISDSAKAEKSNRLKKALLSGLPLTDEKMKASIERIVKAYYEVADIYSERLNNQPKAIQTLEELLSKYPQNSQLLPVYYQLYAMYRDEGNTAESNRYKDSIALRYPNSDVYKIILDPGYINTLNKKQNELNTYYASTYIDYINNDYASVLERTHEVDSLFHPNPLKAKFDLLDAFSVGQVLSKDSMKTRLIKFIKKYPSGDENALAMQVLKNMGYGKDSVKTKKANKDSLLTAKKVNYRYSPNEPQIFIMVFQSVDAKIRSIQDSINNFNIKYHSLDGLNTTTPLLSTKSEMIKVESFSNAAKAMTYYSEISQRQGILDVVSQFKYKMFIIDSRNYNNFYNAKDVDGYIGFFQANYH